MAESAAVRKNSEEILRLREKCHNIADAVTINKTVKNDLVDEVKALKEAVSSLTKEKIGVKQFYWVLGIVFACISGMFIYISDQVNGLQEITTNTRLDVVQTSTTVNGIKDWVDGIEEAKIID